MRDTTVDIFCRKAQLLWGGAVPLCRRESQSEELERCTMQFALLGLRDLTSLEP